MPQAIFQVWELRHGKEATQPLAGAGYIFLCSGQHFLAQPDQVSAAQVPHQAGFAASPGELRHGTKDPGIPGAGVRARDSRDARAKTEDSRDARRWRGTTGAAASLASQMSYRGPVTCDGWPWVTSVWHQTSRGGHPSTRVGHVTARAGLGGSRAATRILQCLGPGTQLAKPQLHPGWPGSRPSGLPGWLGKSLWSATLART